MLIEQQEAMVKGGKARLRWKKTDDVKRIMARVNTF